MSLYRMPHDAGSSPGPETTSLAPQTLSRKAKSALVSGFPRGSGKPRVFVFGTSPSKISFVKLRLNFYIIPHGPVMPPSSHVVPLHLQTRSYPYSFRRFCTSMTYHHHILQMTARLEAIALRGRRPLLLGRPSHSADSASVPGRRASGFGGRWSQR